MSERTSTSLDPLTLARRVLLRRLDAGDIIQPGWLSTDPERVAREADKKKAQEHLDAIESLGFEVIKR